LDLRLTRVPPVSHFSRLVNRHSQIVNGTGRRW
jgi:hypothetical protein